MPDSAARRRPAACALLLLFAVFLAPAAHAQRAAYYVLDGFGGVHAGGGAPAITPGVPYFGFDVARDIAYVSYGAGAVVGNGVLVLDGFGGVHAGGVVPGSQAEPRTPYFGFDVARAIVYRNVPPRATGSIGFGSATITSATFVSVSSATIVAPDDGFLVVTGTANWGCSVVTASDLAAEFSLGVDSTAGIDEADYDGYLPSCSSNLFTDTIAITRLLPVAAGAHTVHLLARKTGASGQFGNLGVRRSSIVVVFVDQAADGSS